MFNIVTGEKTTPIIRKLIRLGGSRVVAVPRSWVRHIENKTGQAVEEVEMEVDSTLTISPVIKRAKQ